MLLDEHVGDGVHHRFVSIASDAGAGRFVMNVGGEVGVVLDKGRRRMVCAALQLLNPNRCDPSHPILRVSSASTRHRSTARR